MEEIKSDQVFKECLKEAYLGVYYFTDNCGVCHVLKPKVKDLFDSLNIPVLALNLMKHASVAGQQLIMGVPTLIVYRNGNEVIREGAYMQMPKLREDLLKFKA